MTLRRHAIGSASNRSRAGRTHRLSRGVMGFVMALVCLTMTAQPAHAAAQGHLQIKGAGSYYSDVSHIVQSVPPGSTTGRTYYLKVVNDGATAQSFNLFLQAHPSLVGTLYKGLNAVPGNEFNTPVIGPGQTYSFKVKIASPVRQGVSTFQSFVLLRDPQTFAEIDLACACAIMTADFDAPFAGDNIYVKSTGQYARGGFPESEGGVSTGAVKPGGTVSGSVRLVNNSAVLAAISLDSAVSGNCPAISLTVKQGFKNVTAAVANGSYSTGLLDPGQKVDLTVRITATNPQPVPGCIPSALGTSVIFNTGQREGTLYVPPAV